MKVSSMKAIDRYLGMPLSFLILFYDMLKRLFVKRRKPSSFKKILLMKFFGMGSIILGMPLFSLLRRRFPDAAFSFLTFEQNRELMDILNIAERCYYLRTDTYFHFFIDVISTLWKVRKEQYDAIIDLEFFSNFSMTISYLSRPKWKVGYYVRGTVRDYILDQAVYFNQSKHVTEVFLMLATGLEENIPLEASSGVRFERLPEPQREALFNRLNFKPNGNPIIVFNVNASELCPERRWPGDRFVRLVSFLREKYNVQLLFIGADYDSPYVSSILNKIGEMSDIYDFSGKLNLKELIEILEHSSLIISNDSGPLHLASALGKPTVSFFGPETPLLYGPVNNARHLVFYKNIYCSPCLNVYNAKTSACNGNNLCMKEIKVEEVIENIENNFSDILNKNK